MLTEGQTLSWFTGVTSSTSRSTTTVFTSAATMFAVPVNGFNIDTSSQAGSTDTATAGTSQTTASSSSSSPSSSSQSSSASSAGSSNLGLSIGVTLGVVLGILLLGVGAFVLWRRRRARLARPLSNGATSNMPRESTVFECEAWVPKSTQTAHTSELSELPLNGPRSVYELPQRWER